MLVPLPSALRVAGWENKTRRFLHESVLTRFTNETVAFPSETVAGCLADGDILASRLGSLGEKISYSVDVASQAVTVIGEKTAVQKAVASIDRLIREEQEAARTQRTEFVSIKSRHLELLNRSNTFSEIGQAYPHTMIKAQDQAVEGLDVVKVEISGRASTIAAVQKALRSKIERIHDKIITCGGNSTLSTMLASTEGQAAAQEVLTDRDMLDVTVAVTAKTKAKKLIVVGWDEDTVEKAADAIAELMAQKTLALTEAEVKATKTPQWADEVLGRCTGDQVRIQGPLRNGQLMIEGLSDRVYQTKQHVQDWMEKNAVNTKRIPLKGNGMVALVKKHCLPLLKIQLDNSSVKVELKGRQLCVSGPAKDLPPAAEKCRQMISTCREDSLHINLVGMDQFLATEKTKSELDRIGSEHNTVIAEHCPTPDDFDEDSANGDGSMEPQPVITAVMSEGQKIAVVRGDITKQHCDGIVNAANEKLSHGGGVARALADAGGPAVNVDCKQYIQRHHRVPTTQVYAGNPGNLPCQVLLHAVGPRWNGGTHGELKQLAQTCTNILDAANEKGLQSIAMPTVSGGIFGFPLAGCVKTLLRATEQWFEDNSYGSQLTEVLFVDIKEDIIKEFCDQLERKFPSSITRHDSGHINSPPATQRRKPFGRGQPEYGRRSNDTSFAPRERPGHVNDTSFGRQHSGGYAGASSGGDGWGCHFVGGAKPSLSTTGDRTITFSKGDIFQQSVSWSTLLRQFSVERSTLGNCVPRKTQKSEFTA